MFLNDRKWRHRFPVIVAIGMWMGAITGRADSMTTPDESFPPLAPTNEIVLPPDPVFESECMSEISEEAKKDNWRFKNSILTKSDKWGIVWRIDFDTPGQSTNSGLVNRFTCWRKPDETGSGPSGTSIAWGQQIKPAIEVIDGQPVAIRG